MLDLFLQYAFGVLAEGLTVGFLFWAIMYATVESSSLRGAVRAGLFSEAVANLPYLLGNDAFSPISIGMMLVGAYLFVREIDKVGELSQIKAWYGIMMTYFALVAVVACGPI